jgi:hypothetical protein
MFGTRTCTLICWLWGLHWYAINIFPFFLNDVGTILDGRLQINGEDFSNVWWQSAHHPNYNIIINKDKDKDNKMHHYLHLLALKKSRNGKFGYSRTHSKLVAPTTNLTADVSRLCIPWLQGSALTSRWFPPLPSSTHFPSTKVPIHN